MLAGIRNALKPADGWWSWSITKAPKPCPAATPLHHVRLGREGFTGRSKPWLPLLSAKDTHPRRQYC